MNVAELSENNDEDFSAVITLMERLAHHRLQPCGDSTSAYAARARQTSRVVLQLPPKRTITWDPSVSCITIATLILKPHFRALDAAYQLHFYLCLKTRYLKPLLVNNEHHEVIERVLDDVCAREQYHLLETQISPDHLRLLLSLKPDQTVSRSVNMLKGNLSREFGLAFAEDLQRHNAKTLWARGYFARSAGKVDLEVARKYVEAQVSHHGYKGNWTKALKFRNSAFKSPAFNLAHCLSMLDYHLVLVTEYRKALFDEAIAPGLFKYVMAVGEKSGFVIDRIGLLPDHMHLILEAIPGVSIQECALAILNNTRHWMEKHYSGVLKQTGGWNVWHPSFYAGTVGQYSTAQVKQFLGGS